MWNGVIGVFLKKLIIENFKSYRGYNEFDFNSGVNYIVGNNNAGKTTIFNAIDFLINGGSKKDFITNGLETEDVTVEAIFQFQSDSENIPSKYSKYVDNNEIKLKRSSKVEIITQNGKNTELNIKKILTYNPNAEEDKVYGGQYENPSGIDSTIKEMISIEPVYADIHNDDVINFGSTKITGKLIKGAIGDFEESNQYKNFKIAHEAAFGDNGLQGRLSDLSGEISDIIKSQFGDAEIDFDFNIPDTQDLIKKGTIKITENDNTTDAKDNGNGMQRALALALIQKYSTSKNKDSSLLFLIDEPELYLHPLAQDNLLNSFNRISDQNQFFITTHSPYILRHYRSNKDKINIVFKNGTENRTIEKNELIMQPTSISEITYRAFGVPTAELHSQLFTKIYMDWVKNDDTNTNHSLNEFDKYLEKNGVKKDNYYSKRYNGNKFKNPILVTLPYRIRNTIDHPEVTEFEKNPKINDNDLKESINILSDFIKRMGL